MPPKRRKSALPKLRKLKNQLPKGERRPAISRAEALSWYREIKPFISLKIQERKKVKRRKKIRYIPVPLSSRKKDLIFKLYDEAQALQIRPHFIYKEKNKSRLAKAKLFAQHSPELSKYFKVAFIPTAERRPKIRWNKNEDMILIGEHMVSRTIKFRMRKLAKDARGEAKRVLEMVPDAKAFQLIAGRFLMEHRIARENLEDEIADTVEHYTYGQPGFRGKSAWNDFSNWFTGVKTYRFKKQKSRAEYITKREEMILAKDQKAYSLKSKKLKKTAAAKRRKVRETKKQKRKK